MNDNFPLVIANLKANKDWQEVSSWLEEVGPVCSTFNGTVIFCPSYPFLSSSYEKIQSKGFNLNLGSQDVSQFEQGAHTGEVAASQISTIVSYSIIGHSERRTNFKEGEDVLEKKVANVLKAQIKPIFCVQDETTQIPQGIRIVAYEPAFAIGTGSADSPQNIQRVAQTIKERGNVSVLYGGSASSANVKEIVTNSIDGVLVGATNSLDPQKFIEIIKALS